MNRIVLALAALLIWAFPLHAAEQPRLSERSLLLPGLWWKPQADGNGLDLHLSADTLGLLWYTYRADGTPTWYVAGGKFNEAGVVETELLEPSWGQSGLSTRAIGTIKLTRAHSERALFDYRIGNESGSWEIVPVQYTAQRVEIDPSGAYYLPQKSGFGLSIDQFGEAQTAVYYAFDAAGQPTWMLGVRQTPQGPIDFERFRRNCARCDGGVTRIESSFAATLDTAPGTASLRFAETNTVLPTEFAQPATLSLLTLPVAARGADYRLARFDDAGMLKRFLDNSILDPEVWILPDDSGGVDFSPAPPPVSLPSSSGTNLIEAEVDEADRVKTDGTGIYLYDESNRRIRIAYRPDPQSPHLVPVGELDVGIAEDSGLSDGKLFLDDDRLVFLATRGGAFFYDASIAICPPPPDWWMKAETAVRIYDRTNPAQPQLIWGAEIDGQLIGSRKIGNQLYLVQRFTAFVNGFRYFNANEQQQLENRALLDSLSVEDLLPKLTLDGQTLPWLAPDKVSLPPTADRRAQPDLTVISRINLRDPGDRETIGIVNGISSIYVSPDSIYLTSARHQRTTGGGVDFAPEFFTSTDIHQIKLTEQGLLPGASGAVDGMLTFNLLQLPFRLSEHQGTLRVLTIKQLGSSGTNLLSQLQESTLMPGLLKTISTLPNAQRPEPIGKRDENLYASRFVGERLYASTFRMVDPFYVIDLANTSDPKIAGEVQMPGFVDYLHPVSERLMLGVGHHADVNNGLLRGVKLALFDVSAPDQPRVVDQRVIGERGSDSALFDNHHAFSALRLEEGRLRFALPIRVHGLADPGETANGFDTQPFNFAGLHAYDVVEDASGGRFENRGVLVTASASRGDYGYNDDAAQSARSILFPSGAAYFPRGSIWSATWEQLGTPVGPR